MRALRTRLFMAALVSTYFLTGCATKAYNLTAPVGSSPVQVFESRGMPTLVSQGDKTDVHMSAYRAVTGELVMDFKIGNHSGSPVTLDPSEARVYVHHGRKTQSSLKIYKPEEFAKKFQQRASRQGFVVDALEGVVQVGSMVAGSFIGDAGQLVSVGGQMLTGAAGPRLRSTQQADQIWAEHVYQNYLRMGEILPTDQVGGLLVSDATSSDQYEIQLPMSTDRHIFYLNKPASKN